MVVVRADRVQSPWTTNRGWESKDERVKAVQLLGDPSHKRKTFSGSGQDSVK